MDSSGFDFETVLQTLGTVAEKYEESSQEAVALRAAAISMIYVQRVGKLEEYKQFLRDFDAPLETIKVLRAFDDSEQANRWLMTSEASPGALVKIGGVTHVVANGPSGLMLVQTLSPEELLSKPPA